MCMYMYRCTLLCGIRGDEMRYPSIYFAPIHAMITNCALLMLTTPPIVVPTLIDTPYNIALSHGAHVSTVMHRTTLLTLIIHACTLIHCRRPVWLHGGRCHLPQRLRGPSLDLELCGLYRAILPRCAHVAFSCVIYVQHYALCVFITLLLMACSE